MLSGFLKRDKDEDTPIVFEIQVPICTICDKPILWGRRIYKDICWECFKTRVIAISREVEASEDAEIVLLLLRIAGDIKGLI